MPVLRQRVRPGTSRPALTPPASSIRSWTKLPGAATVGCFVPMTKTTLGRGRPTTRRETAQLAVEAVQRPPGQILPADETPDAFDGRADLRDRFDREAFDHYLRIDLADALEPAQIARLHEQDVRTVGENGLRVHVVGIAKHGAFLAGRQDAESRHPDHVLAQAHVKNHFSDGRGEGYDPRAAPGRTGS